MTRVYDCTASLRDSLYYRGRKVYFMSSLFMGSTMWCLRSLCACYYWQFMRANCQSNLDARSLQRRHFLHKPTSWFQIFPKTACNQSGSTAFIFSCAHLIYSISLSPLNFLNCAKIAQTSWTNHHSCYLSLMPTLIQKHVKKYSGNFIRTVFYLNRW